MDVLLSVITVAMAVSCLAAIVMADFRERRDKRQRQFVELRSNPAYRRRTRSR